MADATYQPKVYHEQGGDRQVVASGGSLDIESGGEIDVESGGSLKLAGTAITSSAAELNIMTGVTATASELNILDTVTATAAELNYLDITTLGTGAASKAVVLDANGAYVGPTAASTKFTWSVTSDSTDGGTSVEPFVHNTTMTGAGGVGGRARFELDTNVALGAWANALKGQTQFGATGSVTGLGSAIVAEMYLSAGTTSGTYAPLEIELNLPSGSSTGTATSLIYMSLNDTPAPFDTSGFLFTVTGATAGAGKFFNTLAPVAVSASGRLRIKIGATTYYIPCSALEGLNDS